MRPDSPAIPTADPRHRRFERTDVAMDTFVSVRIDTARPEAEAEPAIERALSWFTQVERACSRFDPASELVRLCETPGCAVPASDVLLEAVAFALVVADLSHGAFDPTVGGAQQARGLTRNYATGADLHVEVSPASYRDVCVDRKRRTLALARPLLLDLGAVAKGLAIDLAARELAGFERFSVEAGGDLFAGGSDATANAWSVGLRDGRRSGLYGSVTVRNLAVCTSGGDERPVGDEGEHHLLDPRTGRSPRGAESVTVVAPSAMVADALGTAAFVLGAEAGLRMLERQGVAGIITTADGVRFTRGGEEELAWSAFER